VCALLIRLGFVSLRLPLAAGEAQAVLLLLLKLRLPDEVPPGVEVRLP
jgi:hypothetical protein